jgi:hypothetical protein
MPKGRNEVQTKTLARSAHADRALETRQFEKEKVSEMKFKLEPVLA